MRLQGLRLPCGLVAALSNLAARSVLLCKGLPGGLGAARPRGDTRGSWYAEIPPEGVLEAGWGWSGAGEIAAELSLAGVVL